MKFLNKIDYALACQVSGSALVAIAAFTLALWLGLAVTGGLLIGLGILKDRLEVDET